MYKNNKTIKNNNVLFISIAVVIFLVGISLIFLTKGNSKKTNNNEKLNPNDQLVFLPLDNSDVKVLISQQKGMYSGNENWEVGEVSLVAHNSDESIYLIRYQKVYNDSTVEEIESILSIIDDEKRIDLPGWPVGSKELDEFNFIYG